MTLATGRCTPCTTSTPRLEGDALHAMATRVPEWHVEGGHLCRQFQLSSFVAAIEFVTELAAIAEAEQHHPDFSVHYDRVRVEVWTHAIDGLSENDFILAAKIDRLAATLAASC